MTEFLLVMIDRSETPQLVNDPLDGREVALPDCLPPLCNELSGTPKVRAFADAGRPTIEFPFPCIRVTKVCRHSEPVDDRQLPSDLVRVPGHERAFASLISIGQCRSFGIAAIARDPAERHCEALLDFPSELGPRLLGLDLGEQGIKVRERTARLFAGVQIAAVGSLDVLLGLIHARNCR